MSGKFKYSRAALKGLEGALIAAAAGAGSIEGIEQCADISLDDPEKAVTTAVCFVAGFLFRFLRNMIKQKLKEKRRQYG